MSLPRQNLLDLDRAGLERFFVQTLGEQRYRAQQVMKWIHHRFVTDFAQMTDLGNTLRAKLQAQAQICVPSVIWQKESADGTRKWLIAMDADGKNAIETVFIPDKSRGTLCVSSQIGCGLNCTFCSTATQGFNRNLTTAEIIGQVWIAARELGNRPHQRRRLTNIVMMGMGEPLLNFDAVVSAMAIMRDDLGYGLASKRVTVSTSGLVPMIDRLSQTSQVALAVSLHAPTDALREQLVPLNRKYPIAQLLQACVRYLRHSRQQQSITFEYTMMHGVNDTLEHAHQLAKLLRIFENQVQARGAAKVNLIPFNPFPGTGYTRSEPAQISAFQQILMAAKIMTTVRRTRGDGMDAACGQLKGQVMDRTRRQQQFRLAILSGTRQHDEVA